jgi:hypothetical protein
MTRILILAGALLAITLLRNVLPFLIARILGAHRSHALAQQPDEIHLKSGPTRGRTRARQPLLPPLERASAMPASIR